MRPRLARAALSLAVALVVGRVQAAPSPDVVVAEALFQEAKDAIAAGRVDEACQKFDASNRLDPQLGTLLHLATCHAQQGKTATAWAEFREAADSAQSPKDAARQKTARARADELLPRLARIAFDIDAGGAAWTLTLDGQPLRAVGVGVPIDPGRHTIEVRATGFKLFTQVIDVSSEAGTRHVKATLEADAPPIAPLPPPPIAPSTPPKEAPTSQTPTLRWVGLGLAGVGVAAAGVGGFFGVQSFSRKSDSDKACTPAGCSADGLAAYDDARSAARLSNILLGVGIVAVATGVVLVLTNPTAKPSAVTSLGGPGGFSGSF